MVDICIIGAGTAGLSAAIYGMRAGKSVLVLEALNYGGQIINTPDIENYPGFRHISGYDFATALYEQANRLGMQLVYDRAVGIARDMDKFTVLGNVAEYQARTVILATGMKRRKLDIPGEDKFRGLGVSYCATCDGAFYRNRKAAVAGGGNSAFSEALYLSDFCEEVYLIHRRDTFRGEQSTLEHLKQKKNIRIIANATMLSVNGTDAVASVSYRENATGHVRELPVDGLFVAVGSIPDTDYLDGFVALDKNGFVTADESCRTDVSGVFVAGDCRTKAVRQLTTAAADGTVAALAACAYLK